MLNVKSIIKMFGMFFVYQIVLLGVVEVFETTKPSLVEENVGYFEFIQNELDLIDGESITTSTLNDLKGSMESSNWFNDSLIDSFLGTLKIIGQVILFIIELALLILITPSIYINILFYGFIGASKYLAVMSLVINLGFYTTLFYIVLKGRTQQ